MKIEDGLRLKIDREIINLFKAAFPDTREYKTYFEKLCVELKYDPFIDYTKDLSKDIKGKILDFLDGKDIYSLFETCSHWKNMQLYDIYWKIRYRLNHYHAPPTQVMTVELPTPSADKSEKFKRRAKTNTPILWYDAYNYIEFAKKTASNTFGAYLRKKYHHTTTSASGYPSLLKHKDGFSREGRFRVDRIFIQTKFIPKQLLDLLGPGGNHLPDTLGAKDLTKAILNYIETNKHTVMTEAGRMHKNKNAADCFELGVFRDLFIPFDDLFPYFWICHRVDCLVADFYIKQLWSIHFEV